jgi:hypothetical protein
MPQKQKKSILCGDKIGYLTVLSEVGRGKSGHLQYMVRCDCGKEYIVERGFLMKDNPKCCDCAKKIRPKKPRLHAGEIINNWQVLQLAGKNKQEVFLYECQCLLCKNISYKTMSEINSRKGQPCQKCTPDYKFSVHDGIATGILPNGSEFFIDAEDIELVSKYLWHWGKDYILSTSKHRNTIRLHNLVMGFNPSENKGIQIDHINRKPYDCRKCNLHLVTYQQNSMNKSRLKNSTTGYVGVTFVKNANAYKARIGLNDKRINLGQNKSAVICAQMYNHAASLIFREYAGELNDVPEAPEWVKQKVEAKCKPYLLEAEIAVMPCQQLLEIPKIA